MGKPSNAGRARSKNAPIFDDWPEGFAEEIRWQLMGEMSENISQPVTNPSIKPTGLNLPTSEDSLLKIFKSMGEYIRGDRSFDFGTAKTYYRKFLQTAPEKNKMYLEQSLDAVECVEDKRADLIFGYDGSKDKDKFYFNPDHPNFADYDLRIVFTHELAHRIDTFWVHSMNNAEFSRAIAKAAQVLDSDTRRFVQYSDEMDSDGFISDIFSAICDGKVEFFAKHPPEYWAKPGNKEKEIFANLFSLEAFGDTQKWVFLEENFPDLIRIYLNFKYYMR